MFSCNQSLVIIHSGYFLFFSAVHNAIIKVSVQPPRAYIPCVPLGNQFLDRKQLVPHACKALSIYLNCIFRRGLTSPWVLGNLGEKKRASHSCSCCSLISYWGATAFPRPPHPPPHTSVFLATKFHASLSFKCLHSSIQ